MDSDKKSIQNQGGGAPQPYSPGEGGAQNRETPFSKPAQGGQQQGRQQQGGQNQPQGYPAGGGGNKAFKNAGGQQFPPGGSKAGQAPQGGQQPQGNQQGGGNFPPKPSSMPSGGQEPPKEGEGKVKPLGPEKPAGKKGKSGKKLFVTLLVVIIIIGVLAAGYFFVYPMLTGGGGDETNQPAATSTEPTKGEGEEATSPEEGGGVDVPTVPSGGNETEATTTEATTTEGTTEENGQEEAQPSANEISADSHVSLFSTPADSTVTKTLEEVSVENIKGALEISSTEVPLFREVVLTDGENNLIQNDELLSVLAPNTFTEEVRGSFEADPTLFTYTDDSGTWFGFALSAKSSAELSQLKSDVSSIEENVSEVKNFFLTDPGSETSWKDGSAEGVSSRYMSFSSEGASFNYGWSEDVLLISGSYSAFSGAANRL